MRAAATTINPNIKKEESKVVDTVLTSSVEKQVNPYFCGRLQLMTRGTQVQHALMDGTVHQQEAQLDVLLPGHVMLMSAGLPHRRVECSREIHCRPHSWGLQSCTTSTSTAVHGLTLLGT